MSSIHNNVIHVDHKRASQLRSLAYSYSCTGLAAEVHDMTCPYLSQPEQLCVDFDVLMIGARG